jgi:ribosomal protein L30/L7E
MFKNSEHIKKLNMKVAGTLQQVAPLVTKPEKLEQAPV